MLNEKKSTLGYGICTGVWQIYKPLDNLTFSCRNNWLFCVYFYCCITFIQYTFYSHTYFKKFYRHHRQPSYFKLFWCIQENSVSIKLRLRHFNLSMFVFVMTTRKVINIEVRQSNEIVGCNVFEYYFKSSQISHDL